MYNIQSDVYIAGPPEWPDVRWLPLSVRRPSRGQISKTKQDGSILYNNVRKLITQLILLGHLDPTQTLLSWEMFWFQIKYVQIINTAFCSTLSQTTAVVNRARPSSPVGVVNCCKPAATLETYCSQSLSFVATTPKSNRRRASLKLFFFS